MDYSNTDTQLNNIRKTWVKQVQQEIDIKIKILELKYKDKTEKFNKELQTRLKHAEEWITNLTGHLKLFSQRNKKKERK